MADVEQTIAIVYLQHAEDKDNKCMLTSERLMVVYKGKFHSFDRAHLKDLYFSRRRLLLPLIAGGVSAPLSLLAIFMNLYNPWPLMFVFFLGLALFYLGLQQHPVLTVKDTVKEHDFFLEELTANLKAFLSFARQAVFHGESLLYLVLPLEEWQKMKREAVIDPPQLKEQGFLRLLNPSQLQRWKAQKHRPSSGWIVLHVDPLKVQADIRFEKSDGNDELIANLYGKLSREAILHHEII